MNRLPKLTFLLAIVALSFPLCAQDADQPVVVGGFENHGSFTAGYRFTDVSGYHPKFDELFDLNSGFRMLDFNVFGKAKEGQNRFADDYSLAVRE